RTRYVVSEGELRQRVDLEPLNLGFEDLGNETSERVEARIQELAGAGVDLESGPIARVVLLRLSHDRHVLVLAVHHIAFDGASLGVVVDELSELYAGGSLEPLPLQYRDYAAWQRGLLEGERFAALQRYWRDKLQDLPTLELPLDHARERVKT